MPIALAVHGGAWNIPDDAVAASRDGVHAALEAGWQALRDGACPLDVVERVVRMLEDDPVFDAGRGSRLNSAGEVEMDASIMDGRRLDAGAVAAIRNVRHPVSVARRVMSDSPHVMLAGDGAHAFAARVGAELCQTEDLLVGHERERFRRVLAGERQLVHQEFHDRGRDGDGARDRDDGRVRSADADGTRSGDRPADGPLGTVGAVALDARGRLAAATSTGGTQHKAPGRVGDTPVIGAGTYADDRAGAASATGHGEGILRVALTKTAVDRMAAGDDPERAGRAALAALEWVDGRGGLILVDPRGRVAAVFNTPRMARGWATERDGPHALVERAEPAP